MQILFISHKYPPMTGGMEKQSFELITGVQKAEGVQVVSIIYHGQEPKWLWFARLKARVKSILRDHHVDLIHFNDGLVATFCYWIKKLTPAPITATFHGLDITFPSVWFQRYGINTLRQIDLGICVSNATKELCISRDFNDNKLCMITNGVDHKMPQKILSKAELTSSLNKAYQLDIQDKKIIISIGRVVRRKGFSWFATNVAPYLHDDIIWLHVGPYEKRESYIKWFPKSILNKIELFAGGMSDSEDLKAAIKNLSGKGHLLGKISQPLLDSLLHHAQLFIMPNIPVDGDAEGFGLVALEASIASIWVIASDLEGIPSAVHTNKNGLLLPPLQEKLWVNTINDLMQQQAMLSHLGKEGQAYTLETFSWDIMASGYVAQFRTLINSQKELYIKKQ